jgi:hypothetical protein
MKIGMGTRRQRLILTALALAASAISWAAIPPGDSPEAREVKEQFTRQVGRITSLEVSYALTGRSDLKPAQLLALSGFRNKLFHPNEDWTEAIKGEKRYRRQLQPERVDYLDEPDEFGLVPPQPARPDDPEAIQQNQRRLKDEYDRAVAKSRAAQHAQGGPNRPKKDPGLVPVSERDVTRAFNGRTVWMRHPIDDKTNEVQIWPLGQKALHFFGATSYLSAVGIQPADPTAKGHQVQRAQEMFRLADWFKGQAYAVEKTEVIDGSTCVVLKGSLNGWFKSVAGIALPVADVVDRIWLDRDHGWAVRRREQTKDGVLMVRWENSGLREVEAGLWLPTIVRHERFAEDAPAEWRGKPVMTEEVRVKHIEINHVPDERFDMVPTKADVIEDLRGRF